MLEGRRRKDERKETGRTGTQVWNEEKIGYCTGSMRKVESGSEGGTHDKTQ